MGESVESDASGTIVASTGAPIEFEFICQMDNMNLLSYSFNGTFVEI